MNDRQTISPARFAKSLLLVCLMAVVASGGNVIANQRQAAAPFSLHNLQDEEVSLEQLQGKVVLVNFWASWCPPCVQELPSMQALKHALSGQPFEIVAINVGEDIDKIENFLLAFGALIDFPILLDTTMSVAQAWQVRGMPTSVLIDKRGNRVETILGAQDWASAQTVAMLQSLLDE